MAKPNKIELCEGTTIQILYEDPSVIAIDKPGGWMVAPESWDRAGHNLHLALISSLHGGDFWARSRNLKFLRFIHRLDTETSGILLIAKSPGALKAISQLFENRQVRKEYRAVVAGTPHEAKWTCRLKVGKSRDRRMKVDPVNGLEAVTHFKLLETVEGRSHIEAQPETGRTHQIRLHLSAAGHPILGDRLYGDGTSDGRDFGLRAVGLAYRDPFRGRIVTIRANEEKFARCFGFSKRRGSP